MPFLLLTPRYTSDSRLMRLAAQETGWETLRLGDWRVPPELAERDDLAFYGEPLLAAVIAASLPYALLEPPLDWLPGLPPELRGRDVRLTTLGEARRQAGSAFFKPADDKCFPAKVYKSGAELPGRETLPDTVPVLAQGPVTWEIEFRCFVLERRVVTWSPYLRLGKLVEREDGSWPAEPEEIEAAVAFATRALGDERVELPPAVALDVGRIAGRGWAVIEANAAWGAGLYGCDPEAVLPVLRRAMVWREAVTPSDRHWIVVREPEEPPAP